MKERVYYFPPAGKGGYPNPYSLNFKQALQSYFEVLDKENKPSLMSGLSLLFYAFRADIYILNWIEGIIFHRLGIVQYALARLSIWMIKRRKKKIVWMFHNIHPHQGENYFSRQMQKVLYKSANLIVSHSREAADYASKNAGKRVLYVCHPVKPLSVVPLRTDIVMDVLIWGAIFPYKGVKEFLQELQSRNLGLKVYIVGKCADQHLADSIDRLCGEKIIFENRRASFEELAGLMQSCKYVLFPYVGDCVSSSGALIDTIVLGGYPVGPDKGAFRDLAAEGVCSIYRDYDDLFTLLKRERTGELQAADFIKRNSWEAFAEYLFNRISNAN